MTTTQNLVTNGRNFLDCVAPIPFAQNIAQTATRRRMSKSRQKREADKVIVDNKVACYLDTTYSGIDHVPGLKTTLFPHQKKAVKAMYDLENIRYFESTLANAPHKVSFNAAVLSEPVGSGKTIDILSLICLKRIPRATPDIIKLNSWNNTCKVPFMRRKFKHFIKSTIIFVGASVMKQWELAIQQFTDLKAFSVNSAIELRKMFEMIENDEIKKYDIYLIKNGKVTVPVNLPCEIKKDEINNVKTPYIYNMIANLRYFCWARVVIDDFDTIGLPPTASVVPAIFTWFISSTRKKMTQRNKNLSKISTTTELIKSYTYPCANIMYNHFMYSKLNVRSDINFIKSAAKMPHPKYHIVTFENKHNQFVSLLNSMGSDEVSRITEMINGDALGSAAEAAGIASHSVADIFKRILGSKFTKYRFAGDLLEFIDYQEDKEDERKPIAENPDPNDKYTKKNLVEDFRDIEYKYPGVKTLLRDTKSEYTQVKEHNGIEIQRVKDNIRHGTCPVCTMELNECEEVIITTCCGAVFCDDCGIAAQRLNDRYNKLENGTCSNCRATISIKQLIYIGEDLDIDDIADENFDDEDETDMDIVNEVKARERTKYTVITDIINNDPVEKDHRVDMHIPNMMKGANYLPEAKTRKVLIFANFDETLTKVIKELNESKIKYWRLSGGIGEIACTSKEFTLYDEGPCALVINSSKHCSGLNLQTATDLIFAHRMIDQSVESQVAGRGHRLGRRSPLNIWYLLYENEYTELQRTHSVRELTNKELNHEVQCESHIETDTIANISDNDYACNLNKGSGKNAPAVSSTKKKKSTMTKKRTTKYDDFHNLDESSDDLDDDLISEDSDFDDDEL